VLHAVAIACGLPDGLSGPKKLHLFRVMSENVLATRGAAPAAREEFIGWSNSVQSSNYSVMKLRAKQSQCPYLLAGRTGREDRPHAMWELLGDAQGDTYWERVLYLAVAAGVVADSSLTIDQHFQARMDHVCSTPGSLQRSLPGSLQRSLPQRDEPRKRRTCVDAVEELVDLVRETGRHRKRSDFPSICLRVLSRLAELIEEGGTDARTFALPQSSAAGKELMKILYLAGLADRVDTPTKSGRSWYGLVNEHKRNHPVLKSIDMRSWTSYRSGVAALGGAVSAC